MVESWRDADITSVEDFYAARHWIEKLERLDLLLCDVSLPGEMSGLDVAAMALSAHPAAAIVLFSADPRSDLEGMLDRYSFLQKPFGRDQLLARIDDAFIRVNKQALVAPANQP